MAPMSNAERQRKHREKIKQNAEKHEEKKKKHREYMKAVRRPIAELTEKEKEKKRLLIGLFNTFILKLALSV